MTQRHFSYAIWYEIPGQRQAHAVQLQEQPFQFLVPAPRRIALCGAEVPEGAPWQFDSDFHDCAACQAAMNQKAG